MYERFDIEDRDIFKVCVVATMSSGKSTFINSIIGEEVMPEKNEACTARTMAVLDNDNAVEKKAHIIRKNGTKELITITDRNALDNVNNDEDIVDFLIEADIESIHNTSRALMLIDTPGVNNSADERHGQRTEDLLKQMDEGAVIYLLNATQLATNDDSVLLSLVADYVKENENLSIFFVLNKIDMLDEESESIWETVNNAKDYIEAHGIKNPVIFPVSARSAKLLKMVYYKKEMTRRERRSVEEIYENYRPERNTMLSYALTGTDSNGTYEIGDEEVNGQTLLRAIENTGIVAIEKKIEELMMSMERRYNPKIVIKTSFDESVGAQYEKTIESLSAANDNIAYQKFNDVENQVRELLMLVRDDAAPHDGSTSRGSFSIKGMADDTAIPAYDFAALMADVEKAKSRVDEVFLSDSVWRIPYCTDEYFFPTQNDRDKVQAKRLFLISQDLQEWKRVEFAELLDMLNSEKPLYLYDVFTSSFMKADPSDSANLIALMDVRLPVASVRINGFNTPSTCELDKVTEYINDARAEYEAQQEKIRENEERLKRTYKGIEFPSLEEKEAIQKADREAAEYCQQAQGKGFRELWDKKEELGQLPNAIFGGYIVQLMRFMATAEAREVQEITDIIQRAGLDDLGEIWSDEDVGIYSQNGQQRIYAAIDQRTRECRIAVLDELVLGAEDKTLDELAAVKKSIVALEYPNELAAGYVKHIENLYDIREQQDIKEMCSGVPNAASVDELKTLISVITDRYREEFCRPYVAQIRQRIDYLHDGQLREMCMNVEIANREQLDDIRKSVDLFECKDQLKTSYRDRIGRRALQLDVQDLENLTCNVGSRGLEDIESIYSDLCSGRYNAEFVERYKKKVRGPMERAQIRYLNDLTADLENMSRAEIDEVKAKIMKLGYADRVTNVVMQKLHNRQLAVDLQQLIAISNDFDAMTSEDVRQIRSRINQMDVLKESKACYDGRLRKREWSIALYNVSPYISFLRQVMSRNPVSVNGCSLPIFSRGYEDEINRFWRNYNNNNLYDVPIFMLQGEIYIVVTLDSICVKTGNDYLKYPLNEVHDFISVRKLMFEGIGMTLTNGTVVNLPGFVSKKEMPALLEAVKAALYCAKNPEAVAQYEPYYQNVAPLTAQDVESIKTEVVNDELFWAKRMIEGIQGNKDKLHSYSAYNFITDSKWSGSEQKLFKNMELPFDKSVVMYYDPTFLNTAREGIAVGSQNIYVKKANQPLLKLPVMNIVRIYIQPDEPVIKAEMDDGIICLIDTFDMNPEEKKLIARLMNEYVRDVMLLAPVEQLSRIQITPIIAPAEPDVTQAGYGTLQTGQNGMQAGYGTPQTGQNGMQAGYGTPQTGQNAAQAGAGAAGAASDAPQLKACVRCGKMIPHNVNFCMYCGTKQSEQQEVQQEVRFCTNCGNKIMPGTRFCTNCGKAV